MLNGSTTTPKKGGLIGDPERVFDRRLFTAETQRTQRLLFYCFPLRGRKTIITNLMGYTHLNPIYVIYTQLLSYLSLWRRSFLFWPLSRKENIFSLPPGRRPYGLEAANSASRAKRAVENILSLIRIAKLGPSRHAGRFMGSIKHMVMTDNFRVPIRATPCSVGWRSIGFCFPKGKRGRQVAQNRSLSAQVLCLFVIFAIFPSWGFNFFDK